VTVEFYQTFKEEPTSTHLKLFHRIGRKGTLSNPFCEDKYPVTKTRQGYKNKKENHSNFIYLL
jgi:hypothetical protein